MSEVLSRWIIPVWVLAAIAVAAEAQSPASRDSAGVKIIELPASGWPTLGRIPIRPDVVLGDGARGDADLFGTVSSAVRLLDGTIVVADPSATQLIYFDSLGSRIAAVGRKGSGPGELQSLAWIIRGAGSSVIAYDRARRATAFDMRGRVLQTSVVEGPPRGMFPTGALLVSKLAGPAPGQPPGSRRQLWWLFSTNPREWSRSDTVLSVLGDDPPLTQALRGVAAQVAPIIPFGRRTSVSVIGNEIVAATGDTWELRFFTTSGKLTRILRLRRQPVQITGEHQRALVNSIVQSLPDQSRSMVRAALESYRPPQTMPVIGRVLVHAPTEQVWVQEYPVPGASSQHWKIVTPTGGIVGEVTLPGGMVVLDVGPGYILALRESDGAPTVVKYRLVR